MSSGSRNRVPCSSVRAYPRHTLRFAGQSMTIAPHVHPQRCWPCVFSCLLPICASSLPHDLPMIVSLVPAQQQWPNSQSQLSIFSPPAARLSLASSFACGGPRRAIFGQLFGGGVFLLQDSSRPARRTAKAWCLRPARGTAPRGSLGHARVCCTSDKECRRRRHHRRHRRRPSRPTRHIA